MQIHALWTPSISADVAHQAFMWEVNGERRAVVTLPPGTAMRSSQEDGVTILPADKVTVSVYAVSTVGIGSEKLAASFDVPAAPAAPTGLTLTLSVGE